VVAVLEYYFDRLIQASNKIGWAVQGSRFRVEKKSQTAHIKGFCQFN
jgi:hypothetical protein